MISYTLIRNIQCQRHIWNVKYVINMILNFKCTAENIVASSGSLAENTTATLYYWVWLIFKEIIFRFNRFIDGLQLCYYKEIDKYIGSTVDFNVLCNFWVFFEFVAVNNILSFALCLRLIIGVLRHIGGISVI